MEHITIITDLTTVVVWAGIAAIVFHLLRMPLMLGYLLCGLLVGPHLFSVFPIHNEQIVRELSELGVIFLMFYIGLEFDLGKLKKILPSAIIAVTLQCVSLIYIAILIAPLLGWSSINGLFLGGVLAISSTMITMPILSGQKAVKSDFGQTAIGILILEDIIAILMLVILSGVGLTGHLAWGAIWQVSFLVGVFVVMVFYVGRIISPFLMTMVKKAENPEVLALVVVALVLGIGHLAETFHFSTELGAFLAGAIVSQNELSHKIEEAIDPLRHLFTAIFFVTVGMLIDPEVIFQYWKIILLITFLLIVMKTFTCWFGLFLTGGKSKSAFKAAMCKAHIGEFSFVIASLGQSLGVTDPALMPVAVGVSLCTIIIVPFLSGNADFIYDFIGTKLPKSMTELGTLYQTLFRSAKEELNKNAALTLLKKPILQIIFYFLIFHGIILSSSFAADYVDRLDFLQEYDVWVQVGVWVFSALIGIPFLVAVIRNLNVCLMIITEATLTRGDRRLLMRGSVSNIFNTVVLMAVILIFSGSYLSAVSHHLPTGMSLLIFLFVILLVVAFFWRRLIQVNSRMEYLFMESFNQKALSLEEERRKYAVEQIMQKYPWPIHVQEVAITPGSIGCGKQICDLNIRAQTGASVIAITRAGYTYYDPSPMTPLFPDDRIILLGEEEQNNKACELIRQDSDGKVPFSRGFTIKQIYIDPKSPLVGVSLVDANLRKLYGLNIIGIQRGQERITNPKADEVFQPEDVLMVVSNPGGMKKFEKALEENKL